MTKEIKQRIDQIKNGEVPQGYKKTKIGIVPNEWEENKLKEVCINFIVPMRDKPKIFDGQIPWCRIEDAEGIYLNNSKTGQYVSEKVVREMNLKIFPTGTVICSCSASIGTYLINTKPLITNQTFIGIVTGDRLKNFYLRYYMETQTNKLIMISNASTIPYISRKKFEDMIIPLLPLEEQQKIIDILSTQDKVIELKEKLLKEKEKQKKYLMQILLTGRKRLKGFNGEWKKVKIGSFLVESKEIEQNVNLDKRLTVKLNLKGVDKRNIKTIEMEDATKQYKRRAGQFIYGKQNLHKGAFGIIPKHLDGYQSSTDLPAFDLSPNVSVEWFFYYLSRETYYKQLENIATGTGDRKSVV